MRPINQTINHTSLRSGDYCRQANQRRIRVAVIEYALTFTANSVKLFGFENMPETTE